MALDQQNRVQTPGLGDPDRLDVASAITMPSPGVKAPAQDTRLADLATSLGSFNTALQSAGRQYFAYQENHKDDNQKDEAERLAQYRATHTNSEWDKAVADGSLPVFAHPKVQVQRDVYTGQNAAVRLNEEITNARARGDLQDGDVPAYAAKRRGEILAENGWAEDSGQAKGFGTAFNHIDLSANKIALNDAAQKLQEQYRQGAFDRIETVTDLASKMTPEDAVKAYTAVKSELATTMKLSPKDADTMVWASIARHADKDPNWAVNVALGDRTDVKTGEKFPPLGAMPERAAQLASWQRAAVTHNAQIADASAEAQIRDHALAAFARGDGSFNSIEGRTYKNPITGEDKQVSAKKVQDMAVQGYEQRSAEIAKQRAETPVQTFNREADAFILNDVERPSWKSEIENGPRIADNTHMTNPAVVSRLVSAAQTFNALEQRSPAYARAHTSESARQFYTTYNVLKSFATNPDGSKWTDVQALAAAGNATRNDTPEMRDFLKDQMTAVNSKVASLSDPSSGVYKTVWGLFGYDVAGASNKTQVVEELRRLSQAIVKSGGVAPNDAVDQAAKYLSQTGTIIGGQWMPKEAVNGLDVAAAGNRIVKDYVETHGKEHGYNADDITLRSTGDGFFMVTDRMGLPVPGGPRLTRSDLARTALTIRREKDQEVLRKQHEAAEAAARSRRVVPQPPSVTADQQRRKDLLDIPESSQRQEGPDGATSPAAQRTSGVVIGGTAGTAKKVMDSVPPASGSVSGGDAPKPASQHSDAVPKPVDQMTHAEVIAEVERMVAQDAATTRVRLPRARLRLP